jgi:hypothetical protein
MRTETLRDFIAHHDDRWLFVAVYIGLAVVLSIALGLFWLVAVAGLHFALEVMRQAQHRSGTPDIVSHALWEIKLDIALVLLALAMALYMEVVLGILGLQSAARAGAASRAGMRLTRLAAWERNIRAIVLLADDVARVIQIGVTRVLRRPPPQQHATLTLAVRQDGSLQTTAVGPAAVVPPQAPGEERSRPQAPSSWRDPWSAGDYFTITLLVASIAIIVFAPKLTDYSWSGATLALLEQLHPFPPR